MRGATGKKQKKNQRAVREPLHFSRVILHKVPRKLFLHNSPEIPAVLNPMVGSSICLVTRLIAESSLQGNACGGGGSRRDTAPEHGGDLKLSLLTHRVLQRLLDPSLPRSSD